MTEEVKQENLNQEQPDNSEEETKQSPEDIMRAELTEKLTELKTGEPTKGKENETEQDETKEDDKESSEGDKGESGEEDGGKAEVDSEKDGGKSDAEEGEKELKAPSSFSKEEKKEFDAWPDDVKKAIVKREKDMTSAFHRKMSELDRETRTAHDFLNIFKDDKGDLDAMGLDEIAATKQIVAFYKNFHNNMSKDPVGSIKLLAQDYKVDLENILELDQNVDPQIRKLQDQVSSLNQQLSGNLQNQAAQTEQQLLRQIDDFKSERNDSGDLKYPHFEDVRADMGRLMNSGMAESLQDAYDKAVNMKPDLREQTIRSKVEAELKKQKSEESEKKVTQKAVKSSFNAKSSAPTPDGKSSSYDSIKDELKAKLAEAGWATV